MSVEQSNIKQSNFARILARLKSSPGREYEQATIRLIIGFSVFFYTVFLNMHQPQVIWNVSLEILFYTLCGLVVFFWIYKDPHSNHNRYLLSSLLDISGLSYAMYLSGELGAVFYPLYLWVTFGFGFRYGKSYLLFSAILSLIGFSIVYLNSVYWQQHTILFSGLLVGLVILPLYVSTLLSRLKSAIGEAKAANLAKSQFLANMSHELRTPLNGILGSNDLLRASSLTPEQEEYTETIEYSVNTLLGLINNILDLSKIEAGKKEINIAGFDLHTLLNNTTRMLQHHAAAKGLNLRLHVDLDVPYALKGDENLTRQVLVNLIGNAIKYTDKGGVEVRVSLMHMDKTECSLLFEIIDTGPGIKDEDIANIFERFTQVDNSDTRKYEGSGLGTAIAKEVVNCLGGRIGVNSIYGKGSTFWFELPFAIEQRDSIDESSLTKSRVLVLADASGEQTQLSDILSTWGVDLTQCFTATQALQEAEQATKKYSPFHALIVSKSLIELNATEFARKLHESGLLSNLTLILLTDKVEPAVKDKLVACGFDYILSLPVNKPQLYNAIHSAPLLIEHNNKVTRFDRDNRLGQSAKKYRILLAEDNAANQAIISRMLEKGGHSVWVVENGEEALNQLEQQQYDLCIMDMQMPVMGGIQAVKLYRYSFPNSTMPFIMLTANATLDAAKKCKEAGVEMYLTKPVRYEGLLSAINALMADAPVMMTSHDKQGDNEQNVLNIKQLEFLLDDSNFFQDFVVMFKNNTNDILKKIQSCVTHGDYNEFLRAAHSLKGVAGNSGAEQLYQSCVQAMKLEQDEFLQSAQSTVMKITTEIELAFQALDKLNQQIFTSQGKI